MIYLFGRLLLIAKYTYNANNRVNSIVNYKDSIKESVEYAYNGIGQRIAQTVKMPERPEEKIEYVLDITKQYNNMLCDNESNYYYDSKVLALDRRDELDFYMQDDLGSVMALSDSLGNTVDVYAYNEFGEEVNGVNSTSHIQSITYTGYQKEAVGDTYFAQARQYSANIGRFVSEDIIKGDIMLPVSLNAYVYCLNRPESLVDLNGREASGNVCDNGSEYYYGVKPNTNDSIFADDFDWRAEIFGMGEEAKDNLGQAGVEILVRDKYKIPEFKNITKNGGKYVTVNNSDFYSGGRGGTRIFKPSNVDKINPSIAKSYKINGAIKGGNIVLAGWSGYTDGRDEFRRLENENLPKEDKYIDAIVEGTMTFGEILAAGAIAGLIIGFVFPGVGNVVGLILGALLSTLVYGALKHLSNIKLGNGYSLEQNLKMLFNMAWDECKNLFQRDSSCFETEAV